MVTQAGGPRRLPSLGRDDTLDSSPKLFIRKGSGVVEGYLPGTIEEHERGGGADAVNAQVLLADGGGYVEQRGVVAAAGVADVGELGSRRGTLTRSGNAVALGGCDHGQSLRGIFGVQAAEDGCLALAIQTPVCPEEQQNRGAFELRQRDGFWA